LPDACLGPQGITHLGLQVCATFSDLYLFKVLAKLFYFQGKKNMCPTIIFISLDLPSVKKEILRFDSCQVKKQH
jgi:hypothetical protein